MPRGIATLTQKLNRQHPLFRGLVAAWMPGLASNATTTLYDLCGQNDLTANGTPAIESCQGLHPSLASLGLTAASSQYYFIDDNPAMSTGDIDFTFAAWVYSTSLASNPIVAAKGWWDSGSGNREWVLYYATGSSALSFAVSADGSTVTTTINATTFGALSTLTWYLVCCWHDSVNNQVGISVNTVANTAAHTTGLVDKAQQFQLGASSGQSLYWAGRMQSAFWWKRVLSTDEQRLLYDEGRMAYPTLLARPRRRSRTAPAAAPVTFTGSDDGLLFQPTWRW